jgi:hypothetical protein
MALALLLAFCIWIALGQPRERNGLLLFLATGLAVATWQVSLPTGLLVLTLAALTFALAPPLRARRFAALQTLVAAADQRYRNDTCRFQAQFGTIQSLQLTGDAHTPTIEVHCRTIEPSETGLRAIDQQIPLHPPRLPSPHNPRQLAPLLTASGITLLNDLSVEAKAIRAAMEALRHRDLTQHTLARLANLQSDVEATLALAPDNELLQPSIPQLLHAQQRLAAETSRLQAALASTNAILRQLHDFLQVPDTIQAILNSDLDQLLAELGDPTRFSELEDLFSEAVELNTIYRQLEREKLA